MNKYLNCFAEDSQDFSVAEEQICERTFMDSSILSGWDKSDTMEKESFDSSLNLLDSELLVKNDKILNSIKKRRGNKKDDFDYDRYIKQELKKMDLKNVNKQNRKKLIQKIRNRMSAQRSRQRQKKILKHLEEENYHLKINNQVLLKKIEELESRNNFLETELTQFNKNKFSFSTEAESRKTSFFDSPPIYSREEINTEGLSFIKPFMFLVAIFALLALLPASMGRSPTKLAGIVSPFTSTKNLFLEEIPLKETKKNHFSQDLEPWPKNLFLKKLKPSQHALTSYFLSKHSEDLNLFKKKKNSTNKKNGFWGFFNKSNQK